MFESLDLTSWMCGFQFKFSSIIMPRNLDDCTLVTFIAYMSTQREIFEGQNGSLASEGGGSGGGECYHGN